MELSQWESPESVFNTPLRSITLIVFLVAIVSFATGYIGTTVIQLVAEQSKNVALALGNYLAGFPVVTV